MKHKAEREEDHVVWQGLEGVLSGIGYQQSVNRKLLSCVLLLVLLLSASLCGILVLLSMEPKPVYFGMNQEMQILPLHPLTDPIYTDAALTSWAAQAATTLFNLDFVHWREQLAELRPYCTKQAYLGFRKSLEAEGHLGIVTQYRALMHGVPTGIPRIVAAGVVGSRMSWEVEVPFSIAYETSEKVLAEQRCTITMRIQRMATSEFVKGIAISQLVVSKERTP
ncbi:MAG: DotI/IcmL/TraM family protein [Desulfovibrio sp.]|nr:DotI/IcmL/TraM family protein [Desulfovibrio sp.]